MLYIGVDLGTSAVKLRRWPAGNMKRCRRRLTRWSA